MCGFERVVLLFVFYDFEILSQAKKPHPKCFLWQQNLELGFFVIHLLQMNSVLYYPDLNFAGRQFFPFLALRGIK